MLFTPRYGLFNRGVQSLFGWGLDQEWLTNPNLIMPAVVIAGLWLYVGFNMVYFLAALQNVDQSLIEAARIDGAGPFAIFKSVTLPSIAPVATFVVVTAVAYWLRRAQLTRLAEEHARRTATDPDVLSEPVGRVLQLSQSNVDTLFV